MKRFEAVLDLLPKGHVFDGELVVLDDAGRPLFKELLFGRRRPTYVAFDLLISEGIDLRPQPLKQRKAKLARVGEGPRAGLRSPMASSAKGERCTGRWSSPILKASSLSIWPTPTIRNSPAGIRF
jgi:ATP-dependent DNA ligase